MPIVIPNPITAPPEFPNIRDRAGYNGKAYAWGSSMPGFATEVSASGETAYQNALHAEANAILSANSLASVNIATNAAQAAANYKGEWSALSGALALPATVTHLGRMWFLKAAVASIAANEPALGSAVWGEVSRNDFNIYAAPAGTTNAIDRGMYRMTTATSVLMLPASPWHGMVIAAVNTSGTLTPTIARNGKKICGDAEDYVMNVLGWQIALQYDSISGDWVRISGVTAYTAAQPAIGSANTWTASQNFTAGASFGDGLVIKRRHIVIKTPALASSRTSVGHGLNPLKIVSIFGVVRDAGIYSAIVPVNVSISNQVIVAFADAVNLHIETTGSSSDMYNKNAHITIEYEA